MWNPALGTSEAIMLITSHTVEGTVEFRNRMGKMSVYRVATDSGEVWVRFRRPVLGVVAYDAVKAMNLDDRIRVTGSFMPHPRLNEVLEAKTVEVL